jgi:hypothetical protein
MIVAKMARLARDDCLPQNSLAYFCLLGKNAPMTLADWLKQEKIKPSAFAEMLGVAPSTITRFVRGEKTPSTLMLMRIYEKTEGAVRLEDWMNSRIAAE